MLGDEELEKLINIVASSSKELVRFRESQQLQIRFQRKLEYRMREMEKKLKVKDDEVEEMKAILAAKDVQINRLMEVYGEKTRDDGKASSTKIGGIRRLEGTHEGKKDDTRLIVIISVVASFFIICYVIGICKLIKDLQKGRQKKAEMEETEKLKVKEDKEV
ncbi:hypothetical protein PMAYCL1PPCAC_11654 [Pristionchus mayeri]|uniref:Uncharacterized protein n=1 Tax=Pristionchus mayeri TaxID=1317129 RepID=A0AAN4ZLC8_9BILA|nr:hypothetical protein PMAYCL1PPCAC_11654 [Pristionchus mayeri]